MAIQLNDQAVTHALKLIKAGEVIHGQHDWNKVKPTQDEVSKFLNAHDIEEYGEWFLGHNTEITGTDKNQYSFPTGDLKVIYEVALEIAAQSASRDGLVDIARAAQRLLDAIQESKNK